ncbi:conserved Plasmodium protein, unknown function [Plasmodium berghei]|uniref:PhIL1 interacting protein PIP3, putative n=2 Tax=Plasmodium berghei TaxID=5821 RepID=A0A509AJM9_PLABA|nr:PhIL1 interacting protein PIP3, putative [Plasmodium berghei ANKA]CXI51206.1 conserved Plasmodium protein, unknown function [Plasmodium berghei]SCL94413.1 conserved Plasmodium protein, unknown function [Plasmodium berghei]SCM16013.1 conserved Plasmodium protein, unknown function [Plasmodium berghei]SCM17809.1 conserved Plasmodium protein, unknown function [Plasmodium berghei]SCN26060.1 conserved Plasmodium protein, unknown function [Plasmodium berghei]|eukprot:XP_034421938.1 PhIL1 interacting protein PIP3, putative [Plasmodium berghei ANKA]
MEENEREIKDDNKHVYHENVNGIVNMKKDISDPEKLYRSKIVNKNVKESVMSDNINTITIEKITNIPNVIFKEIIKEHNKEEGKKIFTEYIVKNNINGIEKQNSKITKPYNDISIDKIRQEIYHKEIKKYIPKGTELIVKKTLKIPKIKPKYVEVPVPIYTPCYIEVPIPIQYIPVPKDEFKEHFICGVLNVDNISKYPNVYNPDNNKEINNNKDNDKSFFFNLKRALSIIFPCAQICN